MDSRGWWSEEENEALKTRLKQEVMDAFKKAEVCKRPELGEMFKDVWGGEEPRMIKEQREELGALLKKYGETWEPWRNELAKFKDNHGKKLLE